MTKAAQLIAYVASQPEGCTFGQMQRYVVEVMHGLNYDERRLERVWDGKSGKIVMRSLRTHRGWWCDYLPKIMHSYMTKNSEGRYIVTPAGYNYVQAKG